MIKIVVDSTCDLPQSFIEDHGITVLPLHVIVDGNDYLDGVDISTAEVFSLMRRGVMPTTAQVNLVDAYCSIGALADAGDDVLCLMFSSKMSSTYQSISLVISDLREKYDGQKFVALDSEGGSFATGLITMEAVKTVESGSTFEEVVDRCKFLIDHVEHVFTIDDLKWMVRGGRISKTAGFTGMRCGYTVIPQGLICDGTPLNELWLRRQTTKFNGVSYITQRSAEAALSPEGLEQIRQNIDYYLFNAGQIAQTLRELGIWFMGGENSPYIWLKCPKSMTSWAFFDHLLTKLALVGTPGTGFGAGGEGFFRLTGFGSRENTLEAMERLRGL